MNDGKRVHRVWLPDYQLVLPCKLCNIRIQILTGAFPICPFKKLIFKFKIKNYISSNFIKFNFIKIKQQKWTIPKTNQSAHTKNGLKSIQRLIHWINHFKYTVRKHSESGGRSSTS